MRKPARQKSSRRRQRPLASVFDVRQEMKPRRKPPARAPAVEFRITPVAAGPLSPVPPRGKGSGTGAFETMRNTGSSRRK
jgi:hypothetical protein